MVAHSPVDSREAEIDVGEYLSILRKGWWKVAVFSLVSGAVMLLYLSTKPNMYQATAVITPSVDEKKQYPAIGALASFGISIGGPSSVEDLESLFKSNDLTVRVFRKYNLWPIVLSEKYDTASGKTKPVWMDRLIGNERDPRLPSDWDAIRISKSLLRVSVNKKVGTVSVSFESPSAEGSANIVKYYLDEGKSRLQEEALDRAIKNKLFIEQQTRKTVDALTRDRLYSLYGQEVEREMMARNREQFGFRVIDSPRIPDRKSKPNRGSTALVGALFGGIAFSIFYCVRGRRREMAEKGDGGICEE